MVGLRVSLKARDPMNLIWVMPAEGRKAVKTPILA